MKNIKLIFGAIIIAMSVSFGAVADSLNTTAIDTTLSVQTPIKAQEVERLVDKYGGKIVEGFNSLVEKTTPVAKEGFKIANCKRDCRIFATVFSNFLYCLCF